MLDPQLMSEVGKNHVDSYYIHTCTSAMCMHTLDRRFFLQVHVCICTYKKIHIMYMYILLQSYVHVYNFQALYQEPNLLLVTTTLYMILTHTYMYTLLSNLA